MRDVTTLSWYFSMETMSFYFSLKFHPFINNRDNGNKFAMMLVGKDFNCVFNVHCQFTENLIENTVIKT